MFKKFLDSDVCRKIFFWLLDHSTGDYDAAIIAYDCKINDITTFTSYLYIFDELDIINVDENSETLRIIFNEDSLIVQSFKNLRETFDNEAYRNSKVCGAFVSLDIAGNSFEQQLLNDFNSLSDEEKEMFWEMINNPEDFQVSEDPELAEAQNNLIQQIKQLEENGTLESFKIYLKRNLYI